MMKVETDCVTAIPADALRATIASRSAAGSSDYWNFRKAVKARHHDDALFQYPAMMVSPMQGALIDVLCEHRAGRPRVLDPFVGSGTTLIEAQRRGLSFAGFDLNPLAVMIARAESAEAAAFDVSASRDAVLAAFDDARGAVEPPDEWWTSRWFRGDVANDLAALRFAIRTQKQVELRRLWWACLAEVVRVSGNARLSTPKLQTRPLGDLARRIDVRGCFEVLSLRAAGVIVGRGAAFRVAGHATQDGRYRPGVDVRLADARRLPAPEEPWDVILTSPPYGDNHTTMPYGQASFLPLCWIDLCDTADEDAGNLLSSSRSLDTASLGGSRKIDAAAAGEVARRSVALADVLADLEASSHEAWQRVASFFTDYAAAWERILEVSAPDAHLVLTIGDRTVRGRHVPTTRITRELLESHGAEHIQTLHRCIPHKRIATRNETAPTIREEAVLILHRQGR